MDLAESALPSEDDAIATAGETTARDARQASRRERLLWRIFGVLLALATWTAAVGAIGATYRHGMASYGHDFYQFWLVGDVIRGYEPAPERPVLDIYSQQAFVEMGRRYAELAVNKPPRQRQAAAARATLHNLGTPFHYYVFSLLARGEYEAAFDRYILVSIGCLMAMIAALGWRLGYSVAGSGAATALAFWSAPVFSEFNVVNVNCLQIAAWVGYLMIRDQARQKSRAAAFWLLLAGILAGMLLVFKPNVLLVLPLLGLRRWLGAARREQLGEAVGLGAGIVMAVGVSAHAFGGLEIYSTAIKGVIELGKHPTTPSIMGNIALTRTILERTGWDLTMPLTALMVVMALAAIWHGSRRSLAANGANGAGSASKVGGRVEFQHDLAVFGIGCAISLLTAGLAWLHYPILIFPLLMLAGGMIRPTRIGMPATMGLLVLLAIAAGGLLCLPLIGALGDEGIRIRITPWTGVHCMQIALLATLAIGLWMEGGLLKKAGEGGQWAV